MIEGSTRIEDKFINNGRHLSSGTDTDGKPLAIKDMESIVFTAVTRGTEEFNRRDSTLQLDPLRTKDPNFFEKVGDFFSGGQDYSTLDATEEALKD